MKKIWPLEMLGMVLALSATGICATEVPDLVGNWAGSGPGYHEGTGYVEEADYVTLSLTIVEQKDRLFAGNMTYQVNGTDVVEGFFGVFGADNKSFHIAEFGSGIDLGMVISDDEIELIYIQDGDPAESRLAEIFVNRLYRIVE